VYTIKQSFAVRETLWLVAVKLAAKMIPVVRVSEIAAQILLAIVQRNHIKISALIVKRKIVSTITVYVVLQST
jgi:hypothetical protein